MSVVAGFTFFFLPCRISISNFGICHCLDFTREVTLLLINEPDIRTVEYGGRCSRDTTPSFSVAGYEDRSS